VFFGLALTMTMMTASVALAQKVTTDYDKGKDFTQYKTFMWIKEPKTTNPLMKQRVMDEINAALAAKGLQLVTSNADLAIASHAATKEEHTLNTFYDGFGGGWGWRRFGGGGFGSATTTESTYQVGTLVVDIFDAKTKEPVWRGTATKTISDNPEKNAKSLHEAITKMFKNFPPASKST
jgi:hypothetical protein